MEKLVVNAIRTPDGTVIQSHDRHDFKEYTDKNGQYYMVDGGTDYSRRGFDVPDYEELSLTVEDPHEKIRELFGWGTYGKHGDQPFQRKLLKYLTDEHIIAIIETQRHLPEHIMQVFKNELNWRVDNDCSIPESKD